MARTRIIQIGAAIVAALALPAQAGTITYAYDSQGRLASALYPDGTCLAYGYDAAGNRTQYIVGPASAPTANTVSVTAVQDIAARFDPRINDPTCAALTVTAVTAPAHGTAAVQAGGVGVTYTPAAGYLGADSFSYTISNGTNSSSGPVSVTVVAPTLPPIAGNGSGRFHATVTPPNTVQPYAVVDVSGKISDPYGYPLTVTAVTQGASGSVTFSGTAITWTYPSRVGSDLQLQDQFTYTISNGHGLIGTGTITVNVNVISTQ